MDSGDFEARYDQMVVWDWCEWFLGSPEAEVHLQKALGMGSEQIKRLDAHDLETLIDSRCAPTSPSGRQIGILGVALVHHLTGYLPTLSKSGESDARNLINREIKEIQLSPLMSVVRLRYWKRFYDISPTDEENVFIYYRLSHPWISKTSGVSQWISSVALWYETLVKRPEDLLYTIENKPLTEVDPERAFALARCKLRSNDCLCECELVDDECLEIARKKLRKYKFKEAIGELSFSRLAYEVSHKDFDSLMEQITERLAKTIGDRVTYREQIGREIRSVYRNSLLNDSLFSSNDLKQDYGLFYELADRYFQGKTKEYYDDISSASTDKAHFDYGTFIFDLMVLDKVFGHPPPEDLNDFLDNGDCWPRLKDELRSAFGVR